MRTIPLLVLSLLLSLAEEVHCQQTYPYVSFMNQTLANHSYVNLSLVGSASDNSDSVVCHTDLYTCCSSSQGIHRGDWLSPDRYYGDQYFIYRLPFSSERLPIYEGRSYMTVVIRRTNDATGPTGIYRCDIPTVAVHDDTDISVRDAVFVGLYPADGGIYIFWRRIQYSTHHVYHCRNNHNTWRSDI